MPEAVSPGNFNQLIHACLAGGLPLQGSAAGAVRPEAQQAQARLWIEGCQKLSGLLHLGFVLGKARYDHLMNFVQLSGVRKGLD